MTCDKTVDSYLPLFKFFCNWFVTSKIIKKIDHFVFSSDDEVFGYIDSDIVTFFSNYIDLISIKLNNNNVDDENLDDCDPETFNHVKLMAWHNRYKQHKTFKKDIWRINDRSMGSNKRSKLVHATRLAQSSLK